MREYIVSDNGHLVFGGCDCVELAREYGTPLYAVDEEYIVERGGFSGSDSLSALNTLICGIGTPFCSMQYGGNWEDVKPPMRSCFISLESCVWISKVRIVSISSPKKSTRKGYSLLKE